MKIKLLKPGQQITSKRYNALVEAIESKTPIVRGGTTSNITGQPVLSIPPDGFWAKVFNQENSDSDSDSEKNLSWKKLFVRIENDEVMTYETDIEGTGAFHITGASVSDGTIVYLRPVPENNGYVFGESGGSGTGGGDGSDTPFIPTTCVRVLADLICEDGTTVKQFVWIPVLAGVDCPVSSDEEVG